MVNNSFEKVREVRVSGDFLLIYIPNPIVFRIRNALLQKLAAQVGGGDLGLRLNDSFDIKL